MVQEEVGSFDQHDCSGQLLVKWRRTAREKAMFRITWQTSTNPPKAKETALWSLNHYSILWSFVRLQIKTDAVMLHFYNTRHKSVNHSASAVG